MKSKKLLKILQIAPRSPFPPDDGGKVGIYSILAEFERHNCEVDLMFFASNRDEIELAKSWKSSESLLAIEHSIKNTPMRILKSVLLNHSIFMNKHYSKQALLEAKSLILNRSYDVIHVDHSQMMLLAIALNRDSRLPIGLRLHNLEYLIWERTAESLIKWHPKRIYLENQSRMIKNAESELIKRAKVSFAITEKDRERALELAPQAKIIMASAGVDLEKFNPDDSQPRNPKEMVLATLYNYGFNLEAVLWFIRKVLPSVRRSHPESKLRLIGKGAPEILRQYSNLGVDVLGYVDSVKPYLNSAGLYVAPLFSGGGIRIKILEAMAMKLPVIATKVSAEGINGSESDGLIVEDDPENTAIRIIELMNNPEKARELGDRAREYVSANYSWSKNVGIMIDEYTKLLERE